MNIQHPQPMLFDDDADIYFQFREQIKILNREFNIIITTENERTITGAGKLLFKLRKKTFLSVFERVLNSPTDKTTIKLRRGIKIDFYTK